MLRKMAAANAYSHTVFCGKKSLSIKTPEIRIFGGFYDKFGIFRCSFCAFARILRVFAAFELYLCLYCNNIVANCSGHLLRNAVFLAAARCAFSTITCAQMALLLSFCLKASTRAAHKFVVSYEDLLVRVRYNANKIIN